MKKPNIWTGFTLVILCFFLLFVVYPLFLIMYQSVVDPETHALTCSVSALFNYVSECGGSGNACADF